MSCMIEKGEFYGMGIISQLKQYQLIALSCLSETVALSSFPVMTGKGIRESSRMLDVC